MPRGVYNRKSAPRKERVTNTGRRGLREPEPSTRLERIKTALSSLDFGFTVFFTDERGESIKYYSGAVVQEEARS
jgi:hypothetical protein